MELPTLTVQDTSEVMITFTEKKQQRFKENKYAKLEPRTQKILNRLKRRLEEKEAQVTSEKISEASDKIHKWIARHASERVVVKKETLQLFAENKEVASASKSIAQIRDRLRKGFFASLSKTEE